MCIWGNHSPTMYPDVRNCSVGGKPALSLIDDDWKIKEAEAAIRDYRARHGITSPIRGVNRSTIPVGGPFWTTDPMAFWRKSERTG